nr:MAG TPA: shock protein B [Caudoviricetes sp.]DAR96579.1 MAG TPA: shock protein B [Caudoviricetes sp.]
MERVTTILVVMIPSYFSYRSTQTSKEADKRLSDLSDKIEDLEKSVHTVEEIGKDNNKNLTIIGKGLQRIQRFRLQENLKNALKKGYTNQHEIEEISKLYESYVELGGNGAIKVLFERFLDLEIREEK